MKTYWINMIYLDWPPEIKCNKIDENTTLEDILKKYSKKNENLKEKLDFNKEYIGLCKGECKFEGVGNFCGWYGMEFWKNCDLIAYYTIPSGAYFNPIGKCHIDEIIVNKHYDMLAIGSCFWTHKLIAADDESEENIIKRFFLEDFEHA